MRVPSSLFLRLLQHIRRISMPAGLAAVLGLTVCLTGCYTQLATKGYGTVEPPQASPQAPQAQAAPESDTLAPKTGAPAVIVNNYYDAGPSYRGYAQWEWDYPLLSIGYYSSRFDRFSRPWWWDDPWYSRRHHHHHHHSYSRPIGVSPRPQAPAGPYKSTYKSEKRLYNPDPSYAPVRKGRRSQEPAGGPAAQPSQPSQVSEPRQETQARPAPEPAPKSSSSGSSGSQSSQDDSGRNDDHPTLKKGRRR